MADKVDKKELFDMHSWIGHFIIETMVDKDRNLALWTNLQDKDELEVMVQIDGVEVSFISFIKNIESQVDRMVLEQAMELVEEELRDTLGQASDLAYELNSEIRRFAADKLGVKLEEH